VFSALFLSACNNEEAPAEAPTDADPTVELLRLVKDVEYGEKLTAAKFETVSVKLSQAWVGALGNAEEVIGKYATMNMSAGDYLLAKYLSDKKLAPAEPDAEFNRTNYGFEDLGYIVVTEFVKPNTGEDIGVELQAIIDKNPHSVIYFPDGEYQTSIPLKTNAYGGVSVAIELSENAVIKAHEDWDRNNGAVIQLGGGERETGEVNTPGSNYYIKGGTIDGSGVANGVSINCGRETSVREITIINTNIGVHVFRGSKLGNGNSSDSDVDKITVFGNGSETSIGLFVEGFDNTFSNMRIANVRTGVRIASQANLLHNIQCVAPTDIMTATSYKQTVGFNDQGARNWYENCTSTNFSTGFLIDSKASLLTNCIARWNDEVSGFGDQIALRTHEKWHSMTKSVIAEFSAPMSNCHYIVTAASGGSGSIIDPVFNISAVNQDSYNMNKDLISGKITWKE
jgi:hypothetical protein